MNFTEEQIAEFQSYLSGEMSGKERDAFEQRLSEDSHLRSSLDEFQAFETAIRNAETLEVYDRVGEWEQKHQQVKARPKIRTLWVAAAGIAALVIVALVVWQPGAGPSDQDLVATYFQPYDNVVTVRGKKEVLDKALLEYDKENYEEALELFNQYPNDSIALFYRAETFMALKKYDASIQAYDRVIQQNGIFTEVASFHQALAYLGAGNRQKAISALKRIPKDSFYYDKARDLLKNL